MGLTVQNFMQSGLIGLALLMAKLVITNLMNLLHSLFLREVKVEEREVSDLFYPFVTCEKPKIKISNLNFL